MFLFINKAWGYGDPNPDHYFLALNYRMTELQGAVAVAQLDKLDGRRRAPHRDGRRARPRSSPDVPGHRHARASHAGDVHTYWKYCLRVDASVDRRRPGRRWPPSCKARGIAVGPALHPEAGVRARSSATSATFGNSRWPFTLARPEAVDYAAERFPGTFAVPRRGARAAVERAYTDEHVDYVADVHPRRRQCVAKELPQ